MLPLNPNSQLVNQIATEVTKSISSATSSYNWSGAGNSIDKAALEAKVNKLSGGIGSGNSWAGNEGLPGEPTSATTATNTSVLQAITGNRGITAVTPSAAAAAASVPGKLTGLVNKLKGGDIAGTIKSVAGKISGYAGQLNNLLSTNRASDLPAGAELMDQGFRSTQVSSRAAGDWRVRIRLTSPQAYENIFGGVGNPYLELIKDRGGVVWPYLPNITLQSKATYTQVDTIHSNYPFYSYKNSMVEPITISGEFSAETDTDAAYWIAATTFLRAVTKMFFGQGPNAGNPPPICILDGYGSSVFKNIPVIVTEFSVEFKDDTNYIFYKPTETWVPILSTVVAKVIPVYNRTRLRQFDLREYAAGKMVDGQGVGVI